MYRTVNQVRKIFSVDNFYSSFFFALIFFSCSAPSKYGLSRHATLVNSITKPLNFPDLQLVFVAGGFLCVSKRPAEVE